MIWLLASVPQLLVLVSFIAIFHILEYLTSKKYHPDDVSAGSTLITIPFLFAFSFGVAEFLIESKLFYPVKLSFNSPAMWAGLVITIIGLYIRFLAENTAAASFTHHIAYTRVQQHKLITHGIYRYIRHPGYFGMFVFSVGTQIFLKNPISAVVFTAVLWKFFSDRIQDEEEALVAMFGLDYVKYRERTGTWIPFIK